MRTISTTFVGGIAAAGLALVLGASPASAHDGRGDGAVFVQLDAVSGNSIAAYDRDRNGMLTAAGVYPTGGLGGTESGAPLDALASQSSLVLDDAHRSLLAVNAGSNSVSVFPVRGATLGQPAVVPSGSDFPTSLAVHDDLVYVLNAGGDGSISGFVNRRGTLVPIPGSTRALGLANATPPVFINAPAQIGFTNDGRTLVVTTKSHNTLLTFPVDRRGLPSAAPIVTAADGAVPFSFVVDRRGTVHVTDAGTGQISSYDVQRDGSVQLIASSAANGQAALCWNVQVGRTIYGANAGSATLSSWTVNRDGSTTLANPVATTTNAGPIDLAASSNDRFVYTQEAVAGTVGVYAVGFDGSLTRIQTVTGLPPYAGGGMEGIAAS